MNAGDRGRSRLRRITAIALTSVTAALAILVLFAPSVFSTVLRGGGLWPHGDRYTALYFTAPGALAQSPGPQVPVAFAIENHQGVRRTYSFKVTVGPGTRSQQVVRTGELTLAPGGSQVETVSLPRGAGRRRLVEVRLSGGDTISYWTS
jgi:hypothetical protein